MEGLRDFWEYILAGVAAVAWLIRQEGRTNANAIAISDMQEQRKEDMDNAFRQRVEDRRHADEQRGELHKMLDNVQSDIKIILRKIGQ